MTSPDSGSREVERVTAFTDAAVAIALTLLVLPLVDVAHEGARTPMATLWREHGGDVLAFALSFLVIALFWRAHRRVFETADRIDEGLLTLNTLWLLGVVFLPVPTAILTFGDEVASAPAVLYLANLCYVSALNAALSGWIAARPALARRGTEALKWVSVRQALAAAVTMAVATALAVPFGTAALLVLLALPLVGRLTRRAAGRRPAARR